MGGVSAHTPTGSRTPIVKKLDKYRFWELSNKGYSKIVFYRLDLL